MVATTEAGRITVQGLTKRFGTVNAVDHLDFTVEPGTVTGFLGPNGAGKTTTLRMLLGLVTPDAGTATVGGRSYAHLPAPASAVGAVLEATSFHPARNGRDHLGVYCTINGYPRTRADEVLDLVGLTDAGRRAVRGYSLGMRQRLALAAAMLGDPLVLVLDEPANGLDPGGIVWLRRLLHDLAAQGRTVLVSSHVLSEMAHLVDHVVIINRGRLVHQGPLDELADDRASTVSVRTPQTEQLRVALTAAGAQVELIGADKLLVTGLGRNEVGDLAFTAGIRLHGLTADNDGLEQVFFALTSNQPEPTNVLTKVA